MNGNSVAITTVIAITKDYMKLWHDIIVVIYVHSSMNRVISCRKVRGMISKLPGGQAVTNEEEDATLVKGNVTAD